MIEFAIQDNGASDLAVKEGDGGILLPEGDLEAMHRSMQRVVFNQVKNAVLADKMGFHYCFFTEHHFQPEGNEFSPGPLILGTAIAAQTKRIRLGQSANILSWWHPIRLAEQAAMLDVISGGRLEFGVGRGLQPRETEMFAPYYGSSSTDEARSLQFFEEAIEVIRRAWAEPSFSFHGEFFSFPPTYVAHHHPQTIAYFSQPDMGRELGDVLNIGEKGHSPVPIYSHSTTMKEMQVFPRPLQRPYPQMWQPVVMSQRSMRRAARLGMNVLVIGSGIDQIRNDVESYHRVAEECGWADRLGRGEFKRGWDCEKKRGVAHTQMVHLTGPGRGRPQDFQKGASARLQYLGGFMPANVGFNQVKLYHDDANGLNFLGGPQQVIDSFMRLKELAGYDDFLCSVGFETAGFGGEEIRDQIQCFAEEVMPVLTEACGGAAPYQERVPGFEL